MRHFKSAEFLKDIGIEFEVEIATEEKVLNNIHQLPVANLGSLVAIDRALINLFATYGKDDLIKGIEYFINGK